MCQVVYVWVEIYIEEVAVYVLWVFLVEVEGDGGGRLFLGGW